MPKKRRLPHEQLVAAGKIARAMLVEKKIIAEDSVLDRIVNDKDAPMLPGIPAYLPHQWTIRAAQRMFYDILVTWKVECRDNTKKVENITAFFKFLISELRAQEIEFARQEKMMAAEIKQINDAPVLKDVFSPIQKKEVAKSIQRFFIDSFAISVMLKSNHTTSDYANWFLDWTEKMNEIWTKPKEEIKTKEKK